MEELPPDSLFESLSFLDAQDVVNVGSSCKWLRQVYEADEVWRVLFRRKYLRAAPGEPREEKDSPVESSGGAGSTPTAPTAARKPPKKRIKGPIKSRMRRRLEAEGRLHPKAGQVEFQLVLPDGESPDDAAGKADEPEPGPDDHVADIELKKSSDEFAGAASEGKDAGSSRPIRSWETILSSTEAFTEYHRLTVLAKRWRSGRCRSVKLQGHASGVTSVIPHAGDRTSTTAVSASLDNSLCLWDMDKVAAAAAGATLRCADTLTGHQERIQCAAASENGFVASGDKSGHVALWDLKAADGVRPLAANLKTASGAVRCIDHAGSTVVAGGLSHITLWKYDRNDFGEVDIVGKYETAKGANTVVLADSGRKLLWSGQTYFRLCNVENDPEEGLKLPIVQRYSGNSGRVKCSKWRGNAEVVTGQDDGTVCLWDLHASAPVASRRIFHEDPQVVDIKDYDIDEMDERWTAKVYGVDKAGSLVAAGGNCPAANVWDIRTSDAHPALMVPFPAPTSTVFHVQLLPQYNLLLTGTSDGAIRAYDIRNVTDLAGETQGPLWTLRQGESLPGSGGVIAGSSGAGYWEPDDTVPADTPLWEPAESIWTMNNVNDAALWVSSVGKDIWVYNFAE